MPAFLRRELGDRAVSLANRAAGFDVELLEEHTCYVPHAAVAGFRGAASKSGWGTEPWCLDSSDDERRQLRRVHDIFKVPTTSNSPWSAPSTLFAIIAPAIGCRCRSGARHYVTVTSSRCPDVQDCGIVAPAAAGVFASVLRAYLPHNWRPLHVELNIGKPLQAGLFEEVFRCPVHFNATAVTIVTERQHLFSASRRGTQWLVTIEDVKRERGGERHRWMFKTSLFSRFTLSCWGATYSGSSFAQSMDTSVRTLQRELKSTGYELSHPHECRQDTPSRRIARAHQRFDYEGIGGDGVFFACQLRASFQEDHRCATQALSFVISDQSIVSALNPSGEV